jgi:hypothetical protein
LFNRRTKKEKGNLRTPKRKRKWRKEKGEAKMGHHFLHCKINKIHH